jgi:predicted ATP-grasp superfamily ATP-dependent carboligase
MSLPKSAPAHRVPLETARDAARPAASGSGYQEVRTDRPPAVVVGLCAHGMAVVHALADHGIEVHGLEAIASRPGNRTRLATVHMVPDVNGRGMIDALVELRKHVGGAVNPILFVTNDNMVRAIAEDWERIRPHYRLSWGHCIGEVRKLLIKSSLEDRCRAVGSAYPRTAVLELAAGISALQDTVDFPAIAKPARPLSGFKTRVCQSAADLEDLARTNAADLPFLVQDWITGGEERLSFCALYLRNGEVLARFDGRKLRSRPMGHTTVAEPAPNADTFAETERFFKDLGMSGFVSLEVKRDDNGRIWVIEPTLGRTDAWIEVCTANGINFPYVEYCDQAGLPLPHQPQQASHVWLNFDRDPACLPWYLWRVAGGKARLRTPTFTYGRLRDPVPLLANFVELTAIRLQGAIRVASRKLGIGRRGAAGVDRGQSPVTAPRYPSIEGGDQAGQTVAVYHDLAQIPATTVERIDDADPRDFFVSFEWFRGFAAMVMPRQDQLRFYVSCDPSSGAPAIAAMAMSAPAHTGATRCRRLVSASNYYSPLFAPLLSEGHPDGVGAVHRLIRCMAGEAPRWDVIDIHPLDSEAWTFRAFREALSDCGMAVDQYFRFGNWYLEVAGRSFDQYFEGLPALLRNTVARKRRHLEGMTGYRLRIVQSADEVEAAMDDYEKIYLASWKPKEPSPEFVRSIARTCAGRQHLRLGLIYLDEMPIATQLWIVYGRTASIFKLAYDEAHKRLSPGTVLSAALMRHVIDVDRVETVDYLSGDDEYKRDWMSHRRERRGLVAFNMRTARGIAAAARHFGGRLLRRLDAR